VAETSSLLNCRTRKGTAGSNPASSTLFYRRGYPQVELLNLNLNFILSIKGLKGLGEWRSPVAHLVWDQRVAGSNPVSPT
jgi:hypothetical protein